MDGHFVPNISFGPGVISKLRPHSNAFFDAHLMISHPQNYIEELPKRDATCDFSHRIRVQYTRCD